MHPAQDLSNHHGVTVRLHDDGRVPDDNPFVGQVGALSEIWSYGHRNPQGLAIDPATGNLWLDEHGPQGGDELNLIHPGRNYGWPVIGYGVNYGSGLAIHAGTRGEGIESPTHFWVPSIATSGLMIYTGDRFPEWRGSLFVGGMAGQQLARLTPSVDRPGPDRARGDAGLRHRPRARRPAGTRRLHLFGHRAPGRSQPGRAARTGGPSLRVARDGCFRHQVLLRCDRHVHERQ